MSGVVSANYRELHTAEQIQRVAAECAEAWQDPQIPIRQYEIVKPELVAYRHGKPCAPFDALGRCLRRIPPMRRYPTLLDVGASGGYYSEVASLSGFACQYTGIDFSSAFKALAEQLYPGIRFDIGDARALPYRTDEFDIVLSGCCMLHIADYPAVIRETARVAYRYAIFSKTPVIVGGKTRYYEKEGYGCRMLEIHFGEEELLELLEQNNLTLIHYEDVAMESPLVYRTYLLQKPEGIRHQSV